MLSFSCASASSSVMVLLVMTSFRCWKNRSSLLFRKFNVREVGGCGLDKLKKSLRQEMFRDGFEGSDVVSVV